jgi:hypothetical protein
MTLGHFGRFPPPKRNGRSRFAEETFNEPCGNGEDAPIPDVREATIELPDSTEAV